MSPIFLILLVFTADAVYCQLGSLCPKLFQYELCTENARWYGEITLISEFDLTGVSVRIILDKPSVQLGNWFGAVVTTDYKEYLIENKRHRLKANTPIKIRFYVRYKRNEPPPQLIEVRLNNRTVCPEGVPTTQAPTTTTQVLTSSSQLLTTSIQLLTSTEPSTTSVPVTNQPSPESSEVLVQPEEESVLQGEDDDDFFRGDFAILEELNDNKKNNDKECGVVTKQLQPSTTDGQATQEGEFPWHATLYLSKNENLTYICGASLISRYHLITVAQCVTRRKTTLAPETLVVYLGKFYSKSWSNPGIQDKKVEKVLVHPNNNPRTFSHNVAVLKLISAVDITDYVRPVCLWEGSPALEPVIGKEGTVAGWGFDENGQFTEELTKVQMPVVSQETCIDSFPEFYKIFTSDFTFCAGFRNGTSVCNGNSGGGLVLPKPGTNSNNTVWVLRGLVSLGAALQNNIMCDVTEYVVFTDVAKYLDWIKEALMT